jgi:hypothetical protein
MRTLSSVSEPTSSVINPLEILSVKLLNKMKFFFLLNVASLISAVSGFQTNSVPSSKVSSFTFTSTSMKASMAPSLFEPAKRDEQYGSNVAQYLLDLHDNKGTFDFCGGMMFQLMLSNKLHQCLSTVAASGDGDGKQPEIFDASNPRMFNVPGYSKSGDADNSQFFHGRELRKVPGAEGGFGFVLQLSLADGDDPDPEGWSKEEISGYNGWEHDVNRKWRTAADYEAEGFNDFKEKFGENAFGLNHRFYLHLDSGNRMWLSAEDGCEGTPAEAENRNPISRMFGF